MLSTQRRFPRPVSRKSAEFSRRLDRFPIGLHNAAAQGPRTRRNGVDRSHSRMCCVDEHGHEHEREARARERARRASRATQRVMRITYTAYGLAYLNLSRQVNPRPAPARAFLLVGFFFPPPPCSLSRQASRAEGCQSLLDCQGYITANADRFPSFLARNKLLGPRGHVVPFFLPSFLL